MTKLKISSDQSLTFANFTLFYMFFVCFSGIVRRKTLVLDLDETLIHSFHDGVLRPTVRPGTPPDFILKVTIDRHPVRFFVHKRPHVDFFLQIVSIRVFFLQILSIFRLYLSAGSPISFLLVCCTLF